MVDVNLMRGDNWIRCCICGALHTAPYPHLFMDERRNLHDVCESTCAIEAGLVEGEPLG